MSHLPSHGPGPFELPSGREGVLPVQYLANAISSNVISGGGFTIPHENLQPASVDLRLGEVAYRIRCSFLPDDETVERKLKDVLIDEINLHAEGAVLETNRPYLIPLKERLALPPTVRGRVRDHSGGQSMTTYAKLRIIAFLALALVGLVSGVGWAGAVIEVRIDDLTDAPGAAHGVA